MGIKTSGGMSNGNMEFRKSPSMIGQDRPGKTSNIKTSAMTRSSDMKVSNPKERSGEGIKSTVKC